MRKSTALVAVALALALGLVAGGAGREEGDQPYTPSRLEWLALSLNARYRIVSMLPRAGVGIAYIAERPNTLVIAINHDPDVTRTTLEQFLAPVRLAVRTEISNRGWDWVQVKEEYGPAADR